MYSTFKFVSMEHGPSSRQYWWKVKLTFICSFGLYSKLGNKLAIFVFVCFLSVCFPQNICHSYHLCGKCIRCRLAYPDPLHVKPTVFLWHCYMFQNKYVILREFLVVCTEVTKFIILKLLHKWPLQ